MKINDNIFDEKIKEKLKEENYYVPENVNNIFDSTIDRIKSRRKNKFKKVAGVCAACLAVSIFLGITMPAYASRLPFIGGIFEVFKSNRYENYDKYSSDLNITKESNGIKTTINKVVYDGIELAIFYTIESETPMDKVPYFLGKEIKINGEATSFSSGGRGEFLEGNKVYVGIESYDVSLQSVVPKEIQEKDFYGGYVEIPDEFLLSIEVNKIGDIGEKEVVSGQWNFDIPVTNENLRGMVKDYDMNIDLSIICSGSLINKAILTPINTVIQGTSTNQNGCHLEFTIVDNKGRYILPKKGSGSGHMGENQDYKYYFNYSFKEVYDDTESLTFIPYERVMTEESSAQNNGGVQFLPELREALDLNGETKLNSKDGNDYGIITKIEVSDGKTKLYFKSKYGLLAAPTEIVDKNTNEVISPVDNFNFMETSTSRYLNETGEVMVEFNGELTGDNYEVKYYDISERVIIYSDNAFKIDIAE